MDIITWELMETEAKLEALEKYEQCSITCDQITRLPCVVLKVIFFSLKNLNIYIDISLLLRYTWWLRSVSMEYCSALVPS